MTALRSLLYDKSEQGSAFWFVIQKWWTELDKNRGARARLRRAKTPDEVFVSPDYQRGLIALLAEKGIDLEDDKDAQRLAIGIGVLVHAKPQSAEIPAPTVPFARQLAPEDPGQESVRDPRFRKLLSITEPEPLFLMLRRLVVYLDKQFARSNKQINYKSLIQGASDWTEATRRDWARQYYVSHSEK